MLENIYLIKLSNDTESFYKIGTTVHRFCRFYEIIKSGYKVKIIYMLHGVEFYEALRVESELHNMFKRYKPLINFGGHTECFKCINHTHYRNEIHKMVTSYKEITKNIEISWR